jgi:ParB family transcriptional regulator, chromosome partitioning protein
VAKEECFAKPKDHAIRMVCHATADFPLDARSGAENTKQIHSSIEIRLESRYEFSTPLPPDMAKQALGKGLGALIRKQQDTEEPSDVTLGQQVRHVPLDRVVPSPLQPRATFIEAPLDELVESIRQHGVIQPLIVRPVNGMLELIAGERRWRASGKLGLPTVPVIERDATDREVLEMALIENLQREDLNPIEEAGGYVRLAKEFSMKQDEIAARVGKSRASVANAMRLLDLHPDAQLLVAHARLSVGHAKAVLAIKDKEEQMLAVDRILKQALTVRAAEKLVQQLQSGRGRSEAAVGNSGTGSSETDIHVRALTSRLRDYLATHVSIYHAEKKGRIEIEYYGNDDLQRVLDLIGLMEK